VAFYSDASNLVNGDTNGSYDVFVHDRETDITERVSVGSGGVQGNGNSLYPSISADGRYVVFHSFASNLVGGDTNRAFDVFVRDRQSGTTERVSVATGGAQGNGDSYSPSISADGRYVTFTSQANNLIPGQHHQGQDVFVHDRQSGTTERMSVDSGGVPGNAGSFSSSISADGRYVAFCSFATNLVLGDTNSLMDAFVHDRLTGTTERVSVDSSGAQGNDNSDSPSVSADGRYVAFNSSATNLVSGDTNGFTDVFVHDRQSGATVRVSVDSAGVQGNNFSLFPSISADGRFVAFHSVANNLVSGDTNDRYDVLIHDQQSGITERISLDSGGMEGNSDSTVSSISGDGRFVAFLSNATNLVPGDTNAAQDVFVRDRFASGFTSLCDAGVKGVIACPCANAPSGPGRGCDNSSATGGAILSASGIAYLSMDSLVFTTTSEKPTATSIVMQGTAVAANGLVFGQGVRCVGGSLKRLYTKTASGGSITAPQGGDPSVSARSAALGDVISAGQSRWYLVYYRDPIVLGGCSASSTFNATQTARIDWSL
jgi:Tol biopolymer transport system component